MTFLNSYLIHILNNIFTKMKRKTHFESFFNLMDYGTCNFAKILSIVTSMSKSNCAYCDSLSVSTDIDILSSFNIAAA